MQLDAIAHTDEIANILQNSALTTGYSPQMLRAGFDAMFSHWNATEFAAFLQQEIPEFDLKNTASFLDVECNLAQRQALLNYSCAKRVFMVTASTVPSAAFQDVVLTLLLPLHLIHRPSHVQAGFFKAMRDWLMIKAPRLAERWELVEPTYDDARLSELMASCDAVNISASHKTIMHFRQLRDDLPSEKQPAIWIEHGHKISSIILFRDDLATLNDADFEAIAWDASIWDQTGCLSPKCIFMECAPEDAEKFAQKLLDALDRVAAQLPEIVPDTAALAKRNSALLMAEFEGCRAMHATQNHDCILIHPEGGFPILLPRILNIFPVQDAASELMTLTACGLALASKKTLSDNDKKVFAQAGYHVFCALGQMQNPPLTWFHDNVGTLKPFLMSNV